ncbi:MAG TPA: glycosyltransferase [Burkholderiales bacterium]|nr:glycosyltransferase [Burkholderiales bacterium]
MQFSIAIPVYRQANFLPSALESIRVQARDVQLAVIDATPDDSVQKVLENYRDLLSYRRHGHDAGQTPAIQEGWDNTDGEIVAWLCADDYYFPDTLDAVKRVFLSRPDVDVVYGDSVFVDEVGHFLGYFPGIDSDISSISKGCCISQPSCFVRRTALEAIGRLDSELHYIMDWDLWTRLYRSGAKFHYLNKPLSVVRIYEGTKTSSRSWRRFFEIGRHLWLNATPTATVKSLIGFYYQDLLSGQVTGFERFLLKALDFYRHQKRQFQNPSGLSRRFNYGLSPYGNEVDCHVDVFLPWYNQLPPAVIWVRCDLETAPEVHLDGLRLSVKPGTRFCYEIPAIDLSSYLLHLQLSSSADKVWHLHAVEFQ